MKANERLIIALVFFAVLTLTVILAVKQEAPTESAQELFARYENLSEDELFELKKKDSGQDLVKEIIILEKALPKDDDKMALLVHLVALREKHDEFTEGELIDLIKRADTDDALDSCLVEMYVRKGGDVSRLAALLEDDSIDSYIKEYIVATADLPKDTLTQAAKLNKDSITVTAMKRLAVEDEEQAFELAMSIVRDTSDDLTGEQCWAACLGLAQHLENHYPATEAEKEQKAEVVTWLKNLHATSSDELARDQAIYALARIADEEIFCYIMENEDIDDALKLTTVERNIALVKEMARNAASLEEMKPVLLAMKVLPVTQVGNEISKAVSSERIPMTPEIEEVLAYVKAEGISLSGK